VICAQAICVDLCFTCVLICDLYLCLGEYHDTQQSGSKIQTSHLNC